MTEEATICKSLWEFRAKIPWFWFCKGATPEDGAKPKSRGWHGKLDDDRWVMKSCEECLPIDMLLACCPKNLMMRQENILMYKCGKNWVCAVPRGRTLRQFIAHFNWRVWNKLCWGRFSQDECTFYNEKWKSWSILFMAKIFATLFLLQLRLLRWGCEHCGEYHLLQPLVSSR